MKPEIVIVTVIDEEGNFLLVRRAKGSDPVGVWETPGGHLKKGELPHLGALRETKEETGLEVLIYPQEMEKEVSAGLAWFFLGRVKKEKPKVHLSPKEHDKYVWVPKSKLKEIHPVHPGFLRNIKRLLQGVSEMKRDGRAANQKTKNTRILPGIGEELKEAVLVGDEVEIFLRKNAAGHVSKDPDLKGVVEKRTRNVFWVRDTDDPNAQACPVNWDDRGSWSFIRVYRRPDGVVEYRNGNLYDPDEKEVTKAKGLGIILEPERPAAFESVFRIMRDETPDLDISFGQAPKTMEVVAPRHKTHPVLRQVREILDELNLEPDMVDDVGHDRVMILTQDPDLKERIRSVLKKNGKEVTATKSGTLIVTNRSRKAQGTTTIPIQNDPSGPGQAALPMGAKFEIKLPSPQQEINMVKKQAPGGTQVKQTPGGGAAVTFNKPGDLRKYLMNQKSNQGLPAMSMASQGSGRRILEVGTGARELKVALEKGDFRIAERQLHDLYRIGVSASSIGRANLSSKQRWQEFKMYMEGHGNLLGARIASHIATLARRV